MQHTEIQVTRDSVTFYVIERLAAGRKQKPEAKVAAPPSVPEPAIKV
jgi:hypothetical protein